MYTKQTPTFEYSTEEEKKQARKNAVECAQNMANETQKAHVVFADSHGGYKACYAVFPYGWKLPPFGTVSGTFNPKN